MRHRDLVSFIIDRKINSLSYGGLSDLEKYFSERLKIKMFENERRKNLLKLFIEIRNINVHNGGFVNDIFASRVGEVEGFPYKLSKRFHVDLDALVTLSENAMEVAEGIDKTTSQKFNLKRRAYKAWSSSKNAGQN